MYSLGPVGAAEMVAPEYAVPPPAAGREAASAGGRCCLDGTIPGPACGPTDDCCSPPLFRQLAFLENKDHAMGSVDEKDEKEERAKENLPQPQPSVHLVDIVLQRKLSLEGISRLLSRIRMSIPNNPLSLLSLLVCFLLFPLSFSFITFITKQICSLRCKISKRARDIGPLGHLKGLITTHFKDTFLFFPFRI